MTGDELHILLLTRRGDEPAARELWARFSPRMLAYAGGILGRNHRDSAEDVVQSVFVSILAQPVRRLRRIDDVPSWILRLTRNAALNHLRSARRERARQSQLPGASSAPPLSASLPADSLSAALDALPRRHREPLILKHIAGLTFDQLALALGINRSTAAARYRTALSTLRQDLGIIHQPTGEHHV